LPTRFARLRIARLQDRAADVQSLIDWAQAQAGASDDETRGELARLVPEYRPAR
jgi:hypothetical protein